jgi:hypothetical protein
MRAAPRSMCAPGAGLVVVPQGTRRAGRGGIGSAASLLFASFSTGVGATVRLVLSGSSESRAEPADAVEEIVLALMPSEVGAVAVVLGLILHRSIASTLSSQQHQSVPPLPSRSSPDSAQ